MSLLIGDTAPDFEAETTEGLAQLAVRSFARSGGATDR